MDRYAANNPVPDSGSHEGTDLDAKTADFRARCRQAGLRITPQRLAVYHALLETPDHPSAEAVFRRVRPDLPNISLDTVNRALLTFSRIGAAFVVEGSGDAKRFDGNLKSHQHFRCVNCRRIVDFYHEPFDNIPVPKNIGKNFTVLRKTVCVEGICDLCHGAAAKNKTRPAVDNH
jgi:Fur family peroxide stress response transcriptional regulator